MVRVLSDPNADAHYLGYAVKKCKERGATQAELDAAEAEVCGQLGIDAEKRRAARRGALEDYKKRVRALMSFVHVGARPGVYNEFPSGNRAAEKASEAYDEAKKLCERLAISKDDLENIYIEISNEVKEQEVRKTFMREYVGALQDYRREYGTDYKVGYQNWQANQAYEKATRAGATEDQMAELRDKVSRGVSIYI